MAADGDQSECTLLLIGSGADVNKVSLGGLTALHIACRTGAIGVVRALLQGKGVQVDAENVERQTAQMLTKNEDIIELIDDYRARNV